MRALKTARHLLGRLDFGVKLSPMAKIEPVRVLEPWEWGWPNYAAPTASQPKPKVIHRGEVLPDGRVAQNDTNAFEMSVTVDATINGWQGSSLVLYPGETALITAQGQWRVVGGDWNGPGGHLGRPAYGPPSGPSGGYLQPGAIEGCLLVQDGTLNVQGFSQNYSTIIVHAAGRISFAANDEPHPETDAGHQGYADNAGSLTVTMQFYTLADDESDLQLITLCRLLGKNVTQAEVAEARAHTMRLFREVQRPEANTKSD